MSPVCDPTDHINCMEALINAAMMECSWSWPKKIVVLNYMMDFLVCCVPRCGSPSVPTHRFELRISCAVAGERLPAHQTRARGGQRLLPVQGQQRRGR